MERYLVVLAAPAGEQSVSLERMRRLAKAFMSELRRRSKGADAGRLASVSLLPSRSLPVVRLTATRELAEELRLDPRVSAVTAEAFELQSS